MKSILLKSSVLLICLALTPSTFAKGKKGEGKGNGIFKQLDLSKEQRKELKEIRKSQKDKMKSLRQAKKAAKESFHSAMEKGDSDSRLKSLHKKMLSSTEAFRTARFENMLKTRKILNSEQKKKFHSLKSEWKEHKRGQRD